MSLKFVVRKLEGHSLQDGGNDASATSPDKATVSPSSKGIASPSGSSKTRFGNQPQLGSSFEQELETEFKSEEEQKLQQINIEKEVEDSGTESDDENDAEVQTVDNDADTDIVDSGVGLNTRSAGKVGGKSSLLPQLKRKEEEELMETGAVQAVQNLNKLQQVHEVHQSLEVVPAHLPMDDTDNHSSEEELEDIIGESRKVYVSETVVQHTVKTVSRNSAGVGAGKGPTTTEKRKWSEVEQGSVHGSGSTSSTTSRTGSGSSGDEEVSGYMGCSTTPVQFCTSPPLNVYKPRRSQSPPPKLFHMAASHMLDHTNTETGAANFLKGNTKVLTGAFRPGGSVGANLPLPHHTTPSQDDDEIDGDRQVDRHADRSPNKKQRSTPRPLARQRPCLDFEKMQQIKTKVVTSWRQGTELSLFCW